MDYGLIEGKKQQLQAIISQLESVIVAYSGGVDSSLLAYYARRVLGQKARIVIAVSPSLAEEELNAARAQAKQFAFDLIEIQTAEVARPEYQENNAGRCYFCKQTLFSELAKMANQLKIKHIAYGANVDDQADFRPGHKAAQEYKVESPLQDAFLSKEEIRHLAKEAGLPSWDRPQAACLSSRFPTFEKVTVEKLSQVEKSEAFLHALGFRQVRVRHHGDLARIELGADELARLGADQTLRKEVSLRLKTIGYRFVALDLEGYVSGSANRFPLPDNH